MSHSRKQISDKMTCEATTHTDNEESEEIELSPMREQKETADLEQGDEGDSYLKGFLGRLTGVILVGALFLAFTLITSIIPHDSAPKGESELWQERLSGVKVEFESSAPKGEQAANGDSGGFTPIALGEPIDLGTAILTPVKAESSFAPYDYAPSIEPASLNGGIDKIEWSEEGALYPNQPNILLENPGMYIRLWLNVKYAACSFDTDKMYADLKVGEASPQYSSIFLYPADGNAHKGDTMTGIKELAKEAKQEIENAREHPGEINCEGLLCIAGHFKFSDIKANDVLKVRFAISDDALKVVAEQDSKKETEAGGQGEAGDEQPSGNSSDSDDREKQLSDTDNYTTSDRYGSNFPIRKNNFGLDGFDECDYLFEFATQYQVIGAEE